MVSDGNVTGDAQKISEASNFLMKQLVEYSREHELSMIDVFMVSHNVHKQIVVDAAVTWSKNGMSARQVFRMADMTFRKAMKDLWRG